MNVTPAQQAEPTPGPPQEVAPAEAFLPRAARRRRTRVVDPEFLPSALAVIETPPSPARGWVLGTIFGMLACTAALSYFGYLSDYTSAPGKIQVVGRTKVIEPRQEGQVKSMRVANGDRVKQDDVLVELDPTDALASRTIIADQIIDLRAEMAMLRVELLAGRADPVDAEAPIKWDADIPAPVRARQEAELRANLAQFAATLADLAAQRSAAEALRDRYAANIASQNALLTVTSEHVTMDQNLANEGWNSRLKVLDVLEKQRQQQIMLTSFQSGLDDAKAAIPLIDSEIAKTRDVFLTNATQAQAAAERKLDDLNQQLVKADQSLKDMTLRAPIAGVIHDAAVTTVGQVVKPGQQLMQLVPDGTSLEVIGYVNNTDIGFVKVGQKVELKILTFPYATYGTIPGVVTSVGHDAQPAEGVKNILQSAALDGAVSQTTTAESTGNIVFPITIEAARSSMNIDGRIVDLTPGMALTIDIRTEDRRAIDYIASPLEELFSTAAHEQ
jgi:hemolysin D